MAKRLGVLAKLKMVYSYMDGEGHEQERKKTFNNLKPDQDVAKILAAGNALGSLQEDAVKAIHEIAEYELIETA